MTDKMKLGILGMCVCTTTQDFFHNPGDKWLRCAADMTYARPSILPTRLHQPRCQQPSRPAVQRARRR